MTITHKVELTDLELLLLDGKCSESVQSVIYSVRDRLALEQTLSGLNPAEVQFVHNVIQRARTTGELRPARESLKSCPVCGQIAGYAKVRRSTRYKKKGETDYDKPLYLSGYDFAAGFIRMKGYPSLGCCSFCYDKLKVTLIEQIQNVPCELSSFFDIPTRWKRFQNVKCTECQWVGHEGQMRQLPAIMGGFYPGGCGRCGAENHFFSKDTIERIDSFTLVSVKVSPIAQASSEQSLKREAV